MKNFTFLFLVRLAIKYLYILIISAALFAGVTFSYFSFTMTPVYSATGSVLVTNGAIIDTSKLHSDSIFDDSQINYTDISASIGMSDTIVDILKTNGIYKQLAEKLNNKYSYQDLESITTISRKNNNSLFIYVSVATTSSEESVKIVNEFLELVPDYINSYIPGSASTTALSTSATASAPNIIIYSFVAAVAGAFLSYIIILLVYSTNTVIKSKNDFLERFDIPVIGTIPDFEKSKSDKAYHSYSYTTKGGYVNEK